MTPHTSYDPYGFPNAAPRQQNDTMGLLALLAGVFSLPGGCCCGCFAMPLAIVAILLGGLSLRESNNKALGILGIVFGVLAMIYPLFQMIWGAGVFGLAFLEALANQ